MSYLKATFGQTECNNEATCLLLTSACRASDRVFSSADFFVNNVISSWCRCSTRSRCSRNLQHYQHYKCFAICACYLGLIYTHANIRANYWRECLRNDFCQSIYTHANICSDHSRKCSRCDWTFT